MVFIFMLIGIDILQEGNVPSGPKQFTIIDRNLDRIERIRSIFDQRLSMANYVSS